MEFFDSHAHYNDEKFEEDREEIIPKTFQAGITKYICAGYDVASSLKAIEIAKKYPYIYAICGISPNDVPQILEQENTELQKLEKMLQTAKENKIVAVGEIGLDYYWNRENKQIQKEMFEKQIKLANQYQLPIVIHTREAVEDTIKMLKEHPVQKRGIFHCCPMNRELIKEALKLGYYISFAGPITFKNAKNADEVIQMVPIERLLIETDSPYLSPEPLRGRRNDCRNVKYIAQKIATMKNIPLEEVAKITYQNAERIFEISEI